MTDNLNQNIIYKYVRGLEFSDEGAKIYLALVTSGPQTLSELSRSSRVERTALYRMMGELAARGLVEELLEHRSRRYAAADLSKIERIVKSKVNKSQELENKFQEFAGEIGSVSGKRMTETKYYRGISGIKQILWNEAKAKSEIVGYTYRNLEEVVGVKFFREYVKEIEKNKLSMRDLRSDAFMASMQEPGFVHIHIDKGIWRYLPDKTLHLTHNMDIYDDVLAIYFWEENDVFGVEIHNQKIADMQRSIFEAMWERAR